MSAVLLRPLLYLRVKHSSSTLPWINWWLPGIVASGLVVAAIWLVPEVNAFHATGIFDRLLGFAQSLPGFYLAALAAVATFNRPNLDQLMPGVPPTARILVNGRPMAVGADPNLSHRGCGQKLGLVKQRSPGSCGARRDCGSRVRS